MSQLENQNHICDSYLEFLKGQFLAPTSSSYICYCSAKLSVTMELYFTAMLTTYNFTLKQTFYYAYFHPKQYLLTGGAKVMDVSKLPSA